MKYLYALLLIVLCVYSYVLIDPNITFINDPFWPVLQEKFTYVGYYMRETSWRIYLISVILLFAFHFWFIRSKKKHNALSISLIVAICLVLAYPFLSHDFFNYMFDAKILTYYHQNPYLFRALDFPGDQWLRFMHWTHRTYPYGPAFLIISSIPSFFSFGKFIVSFFLFKSMFIGFYIGAVFFLKKIDNKKALIFATHPLVILEGLISSHNDLIAVSLGIIGIYYLLQKNNKISTLLFLLSGGIKYITLPLLILMRKNTLFYRGAFMSVLLLLIYLSIREEVQPWYFLNVLIFLPFFSEFISDLKLFFFGLLMSYYPYIRLGGWDTAEKVGLKHTIIFVFFVLNIVYLLYKKSRIQFLTR
ncbi:MAG: hypothetical protein Q7S61_05395 [bacterium]|nr:hypothetical protein [bacterium]